MDRENRKNITYVNWALIVVNIVVFLWIELGGSSEDTVWMVEHGAMFGPFVLERGEYYRVFTAMFLHFGVSHLMNNMLILFVLGTYLEKAFGQLKYLIFYLLCGISANVCSLWYYMRREPMTVSAGASGAIFGVMGGLLWAVIRNKGHLEGFNTRQLFFMLLLSLYLGFNSIGVNNVSHITGILTGFLLAVILYHPKNRD